MISELRLPWISGCPSGKLNPIISLLRMGLIVSQSAFNAITKILEEDFFYISRKHLDMSIISDNRDKRVVQVVMTWQIEPVLLTAFCWTIKKLWSGSWRPWKDNISKPNAKFRGGARTDLTDPNWSPVFLSSLLDPPERAAGGGGWGWRGKQDKDPNLFWLEVAVPCFGWRPWHCVPLCTTLTLVHSLSPASASPGLSPGWPGASSSLLVFFVDSQQSGLWGSMPACIIRKLDPAMQISLIVLRHHTDRLSSNE